MPQSITSTIELIADTALKVRPVIVSETHTVTIGVMFSCDATAGAFTVTLPSAGALSTGEDDNARVLIFVKSDSSANAVTISRAGGDTISGSTTHVLTSQFKYLVLIDDESGSSWYIIGSN